jgi:ribosomal protein L44E
MAKITVFECDICKAQTKKITSFRVEIATILLSNGDNKPTVGTPMISQCDVCSDECAIESLSRMLKVDIVEGGEASSGRTVENLELTSDIMPS